MESLLLVNLAINIYFDPQETFAQYSLLPSAPKELREIFSDLSQCLVIDRETFQNYSQFYPTRTLLDRGTFNGVNQTVLYGYRENFVSVELSGQVYFLLCFDSALTNIKLQEKKMKAWEEQDRKRIEKSNWIFIQTIKSFLMLHLFGFSISLFNWLYC